MDFIDFMKVWNKKTKKSEKGKKNPDGVINITTPDGVIMTTSPHPLKETILGKKRKITTRVRRVKEPRTGSLPSRNAAKRRKRVTVEI